MEITIVISTDSNITRQDDIMGWGYGGTVVRFLLVSICPQQKAGLLGGGWRALGLCESCQGTLGSVQN